MLKISKMQCYTFDILYFNKCCSIKTLKKKKQKKPVNEVTLQTRDLVGLSCKVTKLDEGLHSQQPAVNRRTLNGNDWNQVADQRFSLKQWFAAGAHSCRLRKTGFTRYFKCI